MSGSIKIESIDQTQNIGMTYLLLIWFMKRNPNLVTAVTRLFVKPETRDSHGSSDLR
jgi:hypothetical protein